MENECSIFFLSKAEQMEGNLWVSYIDKKNDGSFKYHLMGHYSGVSFNSAVYPANRMITVITSNESMGPYDITYRD
ncbi:hypothetical protein ABEW06_00515 [Peribacillus simplex]